MRKNEGNYEKSMKKSKTSAEFACNSKNHERLESLF